MLLFCAKLPAGENFIKILPQFLITIILGFYVCCPTHVHSGSEQDRLRVIVTIPPLGEFTKRVGGNKVDVTALIPQGANPHTYEPKPSLLKALSSAQLMVKVGTNIEFERTLTAKLAQLNKEMRVVNSSEGVPLLYSSGATVSEGDSSRTEHARHGYDPHIWLSPPNAMLMVENICRVLISVDNMNKGYYERNRDRYLRELEKLNMHIQKTVKSRNITKFMVYHPSWGYFANEYGMEQISIEKHGKGLSVRTIAKAIEKARKYNITLIIASPEFSTTGPELIAKEINGSVALISPLARDYVNNVYKLVEHLSTNSRGH